MIRCKQLIFLAVAALLVVSVAQAGISGQEDTTTLSNWRTAALLEADNEYGTDGYVIWGLNLNDGIYNATYDPTAGYGGNEVVLPFYISGYTVNNGNGVRIWSGNGNTGQIEDPDSGALTSTPIMWDTVQDGTPWNITFTRSDRVDADGPFRVTVLLTEDQGSDRSWTCGLDDGIDPNVVSTSQNGISNTTYVVFDVDSAADEFTLTLGNIIAHNGQIFVSGLAFDNGPEAQAPNISLQPINANKPVGGTVEFKVDADDPVGGTLTWQWVFDPNLAVTGDEVTLTDDADISGSDSNSLIISNIQTADFGYYLCEVSNGNAVDSDMAKLGVGKLVAHWELEGDLTDSVNGYDGVAVGSPTYETGKISQALVLDGDDDHATISAGFDDFTGGITISAWGKPTAVGNWQRFVDFANGSASDNILFMRRAGSNDLAFEVYNGGTSGGVVAATDTIELDVWQMFTATMDGAGNVTLYKNGTKIETGTTAIPLILERSSNFIGKSNWPDALYAGSMDDIRIYNYPLSGLEVAGLYLLAPDISVACLEIPAYDFNEDCVVNLEDFAVIASVWLECGRYPASACTE